MAGRLKIPFTTGILIGIGESWQDRLDAIAAIARLHRTFGHIQEVIIQPLDPKPKTSLAEAPRPKMTELCRTVEAARQILPSEVAVQVPPNLADPRPLLASGASDLGGISPLTADGINPERPWPSEVELHKSLSGYDLRERLPGLSPFHRVGLAWRKDPQPW